MRRITGPPGQRVLAVGLRSFDMAFASLSRGGVAGRLDADSCRVFTRGATPNGPEVMSLLHGRQSSPPRIRLGVISICATTSDSAVRSVTPVSTTITVTWLSD